MNQTERNPPEQHEVITEKREARLRAEIADLKRQLDEQRKLALEASKLDAVAPSRGRLWTVFLLGAVVIAIAFFLGYLPRRQREAVLASETRTEIQALPKVNVVTVAPASGKSELVLPGNVQAITEVPILARASGYVRKRYADIGDRVAQGQLLAEIEAPELEQQLEQAKAAVAQAESILEQSTASLQQGHANLQLAQVTAQRWDNLAKRGVVSRQENDTYQAQAQAQQANVQALEKALAVGRSNIAAAEANVKRLTELLGYQKVRAPFAGVITLRNIEAGTLISEGSTLLYRIAQTERLRTYINVPQADAGSIKPGQPAQLTVADLPGRRFPGTVTRSASALDPATRTLLTEVQVANLRGELLPGMYAEVDLETPRKNPPLMIPGDTLVMRPEGTVVAAVDNGQKVHFQIVQLGRDYGDKIEVLAGLNAGQRLVVNPGDSVREGVQVNAVALRK
jgi:RND family efflux transporter MFP subunit